MRSKPHPIKSMTKPIQIKAMTEHELTAEESNLLCIFPLPSQGSPHRSEAGEILLRAPIVAGLVKTILGREWDGSLAGPLLQYPISTIGREAVAQCLSWPGRPTRGIDRLAGLR